MAYKSKPATAAWIQRERKRLGLSTLQLAERLGTIGSKVSEQTISVWESNADRRPSAYNLDALERIFGSQAPDRQEAGGETAALIQALAAQTEAITQLVREMQLARGAGEVPPDEVREIERVARPIVGRLPTRDPLPGAR